MDTLKLMQFFSYDHLPEAQQAIAAPIARVAAEMYVRCGDSEEGIVGLRKLLEAKDCFVRASLDMSGRNYPQIVRDPDTGEYVMQESLVAEETAKKDKK